MSVRELYLLKHNIKSLLREAVEQEGEYWRGKRAGVRQVVHLLEVLAPNIGLRQEQFKEI